MLLFNEHTWGAHNSISQPDHPFAQSQWAWKRERALDASHQSHELLGNATGGAVETTRFYMDESSSAKADDRFTVYNPHSWTVSQIVELNSAFGQVFDMENQPAPTRSYREIYRDSYRTVGDVRQPEPRSALRQWKEVDEYWYVVSVALVVGYAGDRRDRIAGVRPRRG